MTSAAHAAPGKPGGPTSPQPPDPPGALRYLVEGALPNQPDAAVALILRLYAANSAVQIALQPTKLLEETQTVTVVGGHFTATLGGATAGGIPPSLVAGRSRLFVSWALPSAPTVEVGNTGLFAVPYASTLAPGATITGTTPTPTLEVSNSGVAVHATASGTSARAVQGVATATSGVNYGVEGSSASTPGAGGNFVNTGGGDLIHARNTVGGTVLFRVANNGDVYVRGMKIGQGPQGPMGDTGANGTDGPPGHDGPAGPAAPSAVGTFCTTQGGSVCAQGQNGSKLLMSSAFPCNVCTSVQPCCSAAAGQVCCVYSQTAK